MSDAANSAIGLTGTIVGAGIGLAALGMTLNFVDEMSHSSFTGNKPRKKGRSIHDVDLMGGFGNYEEERHPKKKTGKNRNFYGFDLGEMNY